MENIVRVDGKDKKSILILREELGLSRREFTHDYVSELLRGVITASISALDRYVHDQIATQCLTLLRRPESEVPKELKQLRVALLTGKKSLAKLRSNANARRGSILKADLRDVLHKDQTFQNVAGIERGAKMLGIKSFWSELTKKMPGFTRSGDVQDALRKIATRRNQVVHEADLVIQDRARQPKLREISRAEGADAVDFICSLVAAFDDLAAGVYSCGRVCRHVLSY